MDNRDSILRGIVLTGIFLLTTSFGIGQEFQINLERALGIVRHNNPDLERSRLYLEQQNVLVKTGLPSPPGQFYISGEEFNLSDQSGVHSLNLQQNFYLPQVNKVHQEYYRQGVSLAEKQLALTDLELKRHVELVYYQLIYARQEQDLIDENLELLNDFLAVTTTQLESGETGRLPRLAARNRLGQAILEKENATEKYQIALSLFNLWLQSDTIYNASGELSIETIIPFDSILQDNPHLQQVKARQLLALAKVETEKAELLPQINSGFKLQTASGNFPLIGYQIGVNIPLFRKAYNSRIEAAQVGVRIQEASLESTKQWLERNIDELVHRLEHQQNVLEYLRDNLTPIALEQSELNLQAYREGEIGYLEYLTALEQVIRIRQQYLKALYDHNVIRIELEYWLGN